MDGIKCKILQNISNFNENFEKIKKILKKFKNYLVELIKNNLYDIIVKN